LTRAPSSRRSWMTSSRFYFGQRTFAPTAGRLARALTKASDHREGVKRQIELINDHRRESI
jgi:hypothetical protein